MRPARRIPSLLLGALGALLALTGCAASPSLALPSAPVGPLPFEPGPGTPRVYLQLDPPDTSYPQVELREVAGLEVKAISNQGPMGGMTGTVLVPGSRGLCPVPCGAIIDGRGAHEFFFAGPGIKESKHFELAHESGNLLFKVSPGSQGQWRSGELVTVAGATLSGLGAAVFSLEAAGDGTVAPGGAVLGLGAVLVGVGVTLMLTSQTKYTPARSQPSLMAPR